MKKLITALAVGAIAISGATLEAKPRQTGEEKLAKLLEGRVAGEPVDCINTDGHDNLTIIDGTALVYDAGTVIYVNRTAHPESLDWDEILVTRPMTGRRLCRLDHVSTMDRTSGFNTGPVFLEKFVPYRKAPAEG